MLLFGYKMYSAMRKAIAGRKHPAQLAWAVGFGVLLGLIPHGNLVAVALGVLVLCMHVNHAMTAMVTVLVTLGAPRLDPLFHSVGKRVLTEPRIADTLSANWDAPLMGLDRLEQHCHGGKSGDRPCAALTGGLGDTAILPPRIGQCFFRVPQRTHRRRPNQRRTTLCYTPDPTRVSVDPTENRSVPLSTCDESATKRCKSQTRRQSESCIVMKKPNRSDTNRPHDRDWLHR